MAARRGRGTPPPLPSPEPADTDDARRDALVRAAHDILAEKGPAALTVRRLAEAAGMSTMNVYSRFGGKEGVVDQLFLDGFDALLRAMGEAGTTDEPRADIVRCTEAYRRFALANPTFYGVMFGSPMPDYRPSGDTLDQALHSLAALAALVATAMDAGVLRPGDPMDAAVSVWAACHGLVALELREMLPPGVDADAMFRRTIDAVLDGLA